MSTILQIASADRNFSSMIRGLKATDLETTLTGQGPFTILAPINLAFGKLSPASFDELLKPANIGKLFELLSCHILPEKKLWRDFSNGRKFKTIHGKEISVTVIDGEVRINGAKILTRDRQGSNGVIHSVDSVQGSLNGV